MSKDEFMELIQEGESSRLELKEAKNQVPNSIWQTYSAFANTDGGTIYLGVSENKVTLEDEPPFEIVGVENPQILLKEFWNTVNNKNKVNLNILVDKNIQTINVDDKTIIKIDIPKASYKQKPVFINNNRDSGTYLRNYEGDYHATRDQIDAMIRDSIPSGCDSELIEGYTLDDIDLETLHQYRKKFEKTRDNHIWNDVSDEEFLINIGGMRQDRENKKKWLTAAGLLMFGKGLSIREYFANIRMDYLDMRNSSIDLRYNDRLTIDGTWENNLFNFLNLVIPKLTQDLHRPFHLEGIQRIDVSPVETAIREAVVNMIIHSDYKTEGILKIIRNNNVFIFSNPGILKLSPEEIFHGGFSTARNPRIQKMLELIGYGESIGSGFPKILEAWRNQNWREPDLKYNASLNQTELKLWMYPIYSEELNNDLKEIYSKSYSSFDCNKIEILLTIGLEDGATFSRLQLLTKLNNFDLNEQLDWLLENKFIKEIENKNEVTYIADSEKVELEKTGNVKSKTKLNETETFILEFLSTHNRINANDVLKNTDIESRQGALKALNGMVEKKLLKKDKIGKTNFYSLFNES